LRIDIDQPPIDSAVASHHGIAKKSLLIHAEIATFMDPKPVQFDKATAIEENVEPLSRQQLSLLMLALRSLRSAASFRLLVEIPQLIEIAHGGHEDNILGNEVRFEFASESAHHSKSA
jgi:hypothetical protein